MVALKFWVDSCFKVWIVLLSSLVVLLRILAKNVLEYWREWDSMGITYGCEPLELLLG